MNVVFYSTSSNAFSGGDVEVKYFPLRSLCLDSLAKKFPGHHFSVVANLPGHFLFDLESDEINPRSNLVKCRVTDKLSAEDFAADVLNEKPDVAISATSWSPPFDWMGLKDSLVAEILEKNGVETVCPSKSTQLICFDKKNTADFLRRNNFPCPRSVYVHHEYFWAERGNREIAVNNYKDFVLSEIKKMRYPLVIKDCVGLSSYGMEVSVSFAQAVHYLKNGRNVSDRLVEEYIDGLHFGTEIYGRNGKYNVMPPLLFSLNRYGITSPKLSVKMGPVVSEDFKIAGLKKMLVELASKIDLNGFAQVDLIFSGGQWFVVEINPRLSGMTETYAASMGMSVFDLMLGTAFDSASDFPEQKFVCNFKLPLLDDCLFEKISRLPWIGYLHQHKNLAAKQEREKGYCEAVAGGFDTAMELVQALDKTKTLFPEIFDGPVWDHILWAEKILDRHSGA